MTLRNVKRKKALPLKAIWLLVKVLKRHYSRFEKLKFTVLFIKLWLTFSFSVNFALVQFLKTRR